MPLKSKYTVESPEMAALGAAGDGSQARAGAGHAGRRGQAGEEDAGGPRLGVDPGHLAGVGLGHEDVLEVGAEPEGPVEPLGGSQIGAAFTSMVGGELKGMTKMLIEGRQQAIDRLVEEAEAKGGNAIVAMRFDTFEFMQASTEICAYGTAVRITKL